MIHRISSPSSEISGGADKTEQRILLETLNQLLCNVEGSPTPSLLPQSPRPPNNKKQDLTTKKRVHALTAGMYISHSATPMTTEWLCNVCNKTFPSEQVLTRRLQKRPNVTSYFTLHSGRKNPLLPNALFERIDGNERYECNV